jgi:hypothetical protein
MYSHVTVAAAGSSADTTQVANKHMPRSNAVALPSRFMLSTRQHKQHKSVPGSAERVKLSVEEEMAYNRLPGLVLRCVLLGQSCLAQRHTTLHVYGRACINVRPECFLYHLHDLSNHLQFQLRKVKLPST